MHWPSAIIAQASGAASPDTRLRGPWLLIAHVAWITIFALSVGWFGVAVLSQIGAIQRPCVAATCQLTPAQAASLHQLGIGLGTVAAYYVGLQALSVCASLILALLLFLRRSDDWMALIVGLFLVYCVASFAVRATYVNSALVSALILPLRLFDEIVFYGALLLFPDGRFVPRWSWALWIVWTGQQFVISPVSFFIAIQQHQLFDVDALIKRTLSYGSLTFLLVLMYFGSVIVMQPMARLLTGRQAWQNPVVIVLSTLLIAALVNPLRSRIQMLVDRRFYRAKYDSARTLERFATSLRSEVDLDGLHERLITVVRETMQPALVSLWFRKPGRASVDKRTVGAD